MKKKRYHINRIDAGGRRLPVSIFITLWLLMDRFHAPEWLYGIYWFVAFCLFCLYLYDLATTEEIAINAQELLKSMKEDQDAEAERIKEKGFKPISGGL